MRPVKREAEEDWGPVTSKFENQKALQDYAEAHDLEYVWEGMNAFAKR